MRDLIPSLIWLIGWLASVYFLHTQEHDFFKKSTKQYGPILTGYWVAWCFFVWIAITCLIMHLPEAWLYSLYIWIRHWFLPSWLISWHGTMPGEWDEVHWVVRQNLRLLASLLTWWLAAHKPLSISIRFNYRILTRAKSLVLWTVGGFCLVQALHGLPHFLGLEPVNTPSIILPDFQLAFALNLCNTLILSPLVEELLFRHWLLRWLSQILPLAFANIISALLFALAHGLPGHDTTYGTSLALTGLGLWLGACYGAHPGIGFVTIVHMSYNAVILSISLSFS